MRGVRTIRRQYGLPELKDLAPELVRVPRWEAILSLAIPWICLVIYLLSAQRGWWLLASLGVVLLSFFTYGSISHDLVHGNLGLRRPFNDLLLCLTELLAVRSGHAYQTAHLHHHARYPAADDVEGAASGMSFPRTILEGIILQPKLWLWAVRHRRGRQAWIRLEGVACVCIIIGSVAAAPLTLVPVVYVALVIAGSWIIPLVTSYVPHDISADEPLRQTRLFRGKLLSLVAIEHLYHLEHHLYPRVPHHHWAELARRLDAHFERLGLEAIELGNKTMDEQAEGNRGLLTVLIADGRPLIMLTGLILIGSGLFAGFQAATGYFLPHDVAYLGMTAAELCGLQQCRIVHFMIHDRVAFGGALVAIGTLYLYLAAIPLADGRPWAWWTLLVSGIAGFASFLSYLGYGYMDTWHGAATLVLLPIFVGGLIKSRSILIEPHGLGSLRQPSMRWTWRSRAGAGRVLLLITSASIMLGGAIIMVVGMTSVFVPTDLHFIGLSPGRLEAINPRLIPLIAHDRAGFGGAVFCSGLTMLLCLWCGQPSRALWQAVLITGFAGFGTAIAVHFPIGYTTFSHLAPAYLGTVMFVIGLILTWPEMARGREKGPAGWLGQNAPGVRHQNRE